MLHNAAIRKRRSHLTYLRKHTTDKLYCSEAIKDLISEAIINTIKICDAPELYLDQAEKEQKLQKYILPNHKIHYTELDIDSLDEYITHVSNGLTNTIENQKIPY
jgi:hypothetical protein